MNLFLKVLRWEGAQTHVSGVPTVREVLLWPLPCTCVCFILMKTWEGLATHSVVPGPAASAAPGSLLEMWEPRLHLRPAEPESVVNTIPR